MSTFRTPYLLRLCYAATLSHVRALRCTANAAHTALAQLAIPHKLKAVAPHATFSLVTQNVDELSVRALEEVCKAEGVEPVRQSSPIYEMHGRVFDTVCTRCSARESNYDSPICPALSGTEDIVERHGKEPEIPLSELPRCRLCAGLLRPGVVWFGETPHHMDEIQEIIDQADLGLVVGTSSTVYPAAGYTYDIAKNEGKVAVFNLARSDGDGDADFLFLGPCEELLSKALFEH